MTKSRKPSEPWTAEDNAKIIKYWNSTDTEALLKIFPGRDMPQLASQAQRLRNQGVNLPPRRNGPKNTQNPWTNSETNILIKNFPTMPREELLQRLPGRTWSACCTYVRQLKRSGVVIPTRAVGRGVPWTDDEDKILIENWSCESSNTVLAKLPGRTLQECIGRVRNLRQSGVDVALNPEHALRDGHIQSMHMGSAYQKATRKQNKSGQNGVCANASLGAWVASITFFKKKYCILKTEDKDEAIDARRRIDAALKPIFDELQSLAADRTPGDSYEKQDEVITRGRQIIDTEARQIRAEHKAAKS